MNELTSCAVIGMYLRVVGARDIGKFWNAICAGDVLLRRMSRQESIAEGVPASEFDDSRYVPVSGALEGFDEFDFEFFGMTQREAELTDPQQRLMLEGAWELLDTIGYGNRKTRCRTGVFVGAAMNTYLPNVIGCDCDLMSFDGTALMLGNDKDHLATRLSYKLGLTGPSISIQTACSTSLVAIHTAIQSLLAGECDLALAGGVSVQCPKRVGYKYSPGLMFSADGMCRPFDSSADGTPFSDGIALVALRRLEDASRDLDSIRAVILGSAVNNDGARKVGYSAPSFDGQVSVIREALEVANVDPARVGYIEAHGTATRLGDAVEFAALREVYGTSRGDGRDCLLGSVKANIGHLAAAAGAAGLIKAALTVESGLVPGHPTLTEAHPSLAIGSTKFRINKTLEHWKPLDSSLRVAAVSSFGIGGTNAHVVLQEPEKHNRQAAKSNGKNMIVLNTRTMNALPELARCIAEVLEDNDLISVSDLAYTLQIGRDPDRYVWAKAVSDKKELISALTYEKPEGTAHPISGSRELILVVKDVDQRCLRSDWLISQSMPSAAEGALHSLTEWVPKHRDASCFVSEILVYVGLFKFWLTAVSNVKAVLIDNNRLAVALALMLNEKSIADISKLDQIVDRDVDDCILRLGLPGWIRSTTSEMSVSTDDVCVLVGQSVFVPSTSTLSIPILCNKQLSQPTQYCEASVQAAAVYSHGIQLNWRAWPRAAESRRISLPVQPLHKRKCWFQGKGKFSEHVTKGEPTGGTGTYNHYLYEQVWTREPRSAPGSQQEITVPCVVIGRKDDLLALRIVRQLHPFARELSFVWMSNVRGTPTVHDPSMRWENVSTAEFLRRVSAERLIYICDRKRTGPTSFEEEIEDLYALLDIVRDSTTLRNNLKSIDVLSCHGISLDRSEHPEPARSMLSAALLVAEQETPHLRCNLLDFDDKSIEPRAEGRCSALVEEILWPKNARIVCLRRGERWVRDFVALDLRSGRDSILMDGACLISGGLGRVGLAVGEYLARRYGVRPVFFGRSSLGACQTPQFERHDTLYSDSVRQTLTSLERDGIKYMIEQGDVSSESDVRRIIEKTTRTFGPVTGFVHAAGVSGPEAVQWIARTDRTNWDKILRPRVLGAQVLHKCLGNSSLQFGVFVSSLSSFVGGLGYATYAAASSYLDALAQLHSCTLPYKSIAWDGWQGRTTGLPRTRASERVDSLTLTASEAVEALAQTLETTSTIVAVSRIPINDRDFFERNQMRVTDRKVISDSASNFVAGVALRDRVENIWKEVLGANIDQEENFFDLGGDSLLAAKLSGRISEEFGCTFTVSDVFEFTTVEAMTKHLEVMI